MRPEKGAHHRGNCIPVRKLDLTGAAEPSRNTGTASERHGKEDLKKTRVRDLGEKFRGACL